ncbi:MAG: hypothetical protein HYX78_11560, partial [Armatimonadetes bacterium]|nr:hypothetical protein [Armatimonadota bacterium]
MKTRIVTRICMLTTLVLMLGCANAADRLFSEGLPGRRWSSFTADGYSMPVTGVIYRNGDMLPGMPLGALGTGFMPLGTDGTLDYVSTIFNNFMERREASDKLAKAEGVIQNFQLRKHIPTFRRPFLGIAIDGRTTVLSLKKVDGAQGVEDIQYWGHYPIADVQFESACPVDVDLRAWTPLIPGHAAESNT